MDSVEEMIMLDYERYQQKLIALETELHQLPVGTLVFRTSRQKTYCHLQYRGPQGVRNKRIPEKEISYMQRLLTYRDNLQIEIKKLRFWISVYEKNLPRLSKFVSPPKIALFTESDRPYATLTGDFVRSKSEVIIANALYANKISFIYEKPLFLPDAEKPLYPDFTIYTACQNKVVYWEHLGLMDDAVYQEKWHLKERRYAAAGISPRAGNLIITQESHNAPFDLDVVMGKITWLQQL